MDIKSEKVIELLFPGGIPESWKQNSEFDLYLTKIGKYHIDELTKESDRIMDEKTSIQYSLQNLIISNYNTFICTTENSNEIFKEFYLAEAKLDHLLLNIPQFISKCKSFCILSEEINAHKQLNSLILKKHGELIGILELPELMKLYFQNNQYNEALEVSEYIKLINGKFGDIPIIISIISEIENFRIVMVNKIFDLLKEDLTLSKCLQLIGLLRSMDAFTEPELRIIFIQARDYWFKIELKSISIKETNIHLTRTIELSRIHLFNIITHYKAIFNDYLTFDHDFIINDAIIFYQWLEDKVSLFLTILEQDLIDINSVDLIINQCAYFGLSFARIGADFIGRIADIFIKTINVKIHNSILKITKKFQINLENSALINVYQTFNIKNESVIISENPPEQLVAYYPLAEYCNDLISVFNEWRLNIPLVLVHSFTMSLQDSLHTLAKTIFLFYKKVQQNSTLTDKQNIIKFAECLNEQLIPYVQYCIHALFPLNQIATHFGTSISQLKKEKISYLSQKNIIEPIESILPNKNISVDSYLNNMLYLMESPVTADKK